MGSRHPQRVASNRATHRHWAAARCGEVVVVTVLMVRRRDGAWPGSTDVGGRSRFAGAVVNRESVPKLPVDFEEHRPGAPRQCARRLRRACTGPPHPTRRGLRVRSHLVALRTANEQGILRVDDPEIVTRLLVRALRRGAMLAATSRARSPSMTPFPPMRALLWDYAATRPCKAVQ